MPLFLVVASSRAGIRLPEETHVLLPETPTVSDGRVNLDLYSTYADLGFTSTQPGRLFCQASGEATNLDAAIRSFGSTINFGIVPSLAVCANTQVPNFELEVAYDITPGETTHPFTQSLPGALSDPASDELRTLRLLPPELTFSVLQPLLISPEGERLHRACAQYRESILTWESGKELWSVMHLWMAIEALTKSLLRHECRKQGLSEDGLCQVCGIQRQQLDSHVRVRLIFNSDADTYKKAKDISDGLEHMFDALPGLHERATEIRDQLASYVRGAIIHTLDLDPSLTNRLLDRPFAKPVSILQNKVSIGGVLTGEALAPENTVHPHFVGNRFVKDMVEKDNGDYDVTYTAPSTAVDLTPGARIDVRSFSSTEPMKGLEVSVLKSGESEPTVVVPESEPSDAEEDTGPAAFGPSPPG